MAAKEHPHYKRWEKAWDHLQKRQKFYDLIVKKYPANHVMVTTQKEKLDKAQKDYDKIVDQMGPKD
jgi:hypothetical protein